uniref:Uncharacterized protein n=1 Tax=Rhizophora mucronata TaxID=61149 RepID=A0A2P2Q3F2_RHIMU
MVYSLVKNSARTIEKFPDGYGHVTLQVFGTLVATRLHWVVAQVRSFRDYWIVAFDLNDEKFHLLPTPDNSHGIILGVLGGCLSMGCKVESENLEIWMMKEYGVKDSWTKLCSISEENGGCYNISPLCFSRISDRILFLQNDCFLYWYDQANGRSESACCVSGNFFAIICVRSLVPINASTGPAHQGNEREMTQLR